MCLCSSFAYRSFPVCWRGRFCTLHLVGDSLSVMTLTNDLTQSIAIPKKKWKHFIQYSLLPSCRFISKLIICFYPVVTDESIQPILPPHLREASNIKKDKLEVVNPTSTSTSTSSSSPTSEALWATSNRFSLS